MFNVVRRGASKTIIPREVFDKYCKHVKLVNADATLKSYTCESVVPERKAVVSVESTPLSDIYE